MSVGTGRFALALLLCAAAVRPQDRTPGPPKEPELTSLFPLGGLRGATIPVEIRGKVLKGAYALWMSDADLAARITSVDSLPPATDADETEKKEAPTDRASVQIEVRGSARPGPRTLRLVTPRGVSNAVVFNVVSESTLAEGKASHGSPERAQSVAPPVVIDGAIGADSESDYYSFEAARDQDLVLEVLRASPPPNVLNATGRGDLALTLYESAGSWFDRARPLRLAVSYEPTALGSAAEPRIPYRFEKSGRYLLEVAGNRVSYQVRIGPPAPAAAVPESSWQERSFVRRLDTARTESMWARTVRAPAQGDHATPAGAGAEQTAATEMAPRGSDAAAPSAPPPLIEETQPNETPAQAKPVPIPSILEGAIERPGDTDHFRFAVKAGDRIAFEIETPNTRPPHFNPELTVLDADGKTVLTSVYKRIGRNDTFYVKTPEPKVVYTFEREGEYTLAVRDATSRWGEPSFRYRVLLRPQIPHIGDVHVDQDRLNLLRGEGKKLNVTTAQEEEFTGDIAVTVEGLPRGVSVVPATEVKPERGPPLDEGFKSRFRPKAETASLLLLASGDALLTEMPRFVRVVCRPVVRGVVGAPLLVKELPLTVVEREP